jgi:hypothetical protein
MMSPYDNAEKAVALCFSHCLHGIAECELARPSNLTISRELLSEDHAKLRQAAKSGKLP